MAVDAVIAHVVHVQAEPVAGLVHVEAPVTLLRQVIVQAPRQQAELDQALGEHPAGRFVKVVERVAGADPVDGRALCGGHQVVDLALGRREAAGNREGARDVGGVAGALAAGVDQHQAVVGQRLVVFDVVQHQRVAAAGDDRQVGRRAAVARELVHQFRGQVGLAQARPADLHGARVRLRRDLRRPPHGRDFRGRLDQPQFMQQVVQRDEFLRAPGVALLLAQLVAPADDLAVEGRVAADRVIDVVAVFHQAGQDFVQVGNRKRIVHAQLLACAVQPQPGSVPALAFRIALAAEQDLLAGVAPGDQHQHCIGLVESGQVEEIAVLAKRMVAVAVAQLFARRRHDKNAVGFGQVHQVPAASRQVFGARRHR